MQFMAHQAIRFGVANAERTLRGAKWGCWTNGGSDNSVYLTCRELRGSIHLSLHETGQWHVAFAGERFKELFAPNAQPASRFAGRWTRPPEVTPGWTVAAHIYTPAKAVTSSLARGNKRIVWIEQPADGLMAEVTILLAEPQAKSNEEWPGALQMKTALVGSFVIGDGTVVWITSRNVPLQTPQLPPSQPRFFKSANADDFKSDNLRAVL